MKISPLNIMNNNIKFLGSIKCGNFRMSHDQDKPLGDEDTAMVIYHRWVPSYLLQRGLVELEDSSQFEKKTLMRLRNKQLSNDKYVDIVLSDKVMPLNEETAKSVTSDIVLRGERRLMGVENPDEVFDLMRIENAKI